jgi:nitronate monooxygenase
MKAKPVIIQGGMGVAVSSWRLARAVAVRGQLGVVSGTALDTVLVRRLQTGDPGGFMRRALAAFPVRALAERTLAAFFVDGGVAADAPLRTLPMYTAAASPARQEIAVVAGFAEVFLAKEDHPGLVGINFLEKIQLPTPATLYGALLAGVDYVLMGAGIPRDIPHLLDRLCRHEPVALPLHVSGAGADERFEMRFDPTHVAAPAMPLARPAFLAIVASSTLAQSLSRRSGGVDGFVVEGPKAGGHNAPPRGPLALAPDGQPVYGPRDDVDLAKMRALGAPFWLAGSYGSPARLREARAEGAAGIQVGSAFAFCDESGIDPGLRRRVLEGVRRGAARVFTDPSASPTGFPFKVAELDGTLSEEAVYEARERRCDLGYLRETYRSRGGALGYRCPAEPVDDYVRKQGDLGDTAGRKCICNGLLATIGLGQRRKGAIEPAIVTAGDDLPGFARLLEGDGLCYSAADVVRYLLDEGPLAR